VIGAAEKYVNIVFAENSSNIARDSILFDKSEAYVKIKLDMKIFYIHNIYTDIVKWGLNGKRLSMPEGEREFEEAAERAHKKKSQEKEVMFQLGVKLLG
jgi:hypothetical protein